MGEACSEGCRLLWQGVVVVASGPVLLMSAVIEQRDVQSSARLMRKELNGGDLVCGKTSVCSSVPGLAHRSRTHRTFATRVGARLGQEIDGIRCP